jgi:hypothetical protein
MNHRSLFALFSLAFGAAVVFAFVTSTYVPAPYDRAAMLRHFGRKI